MPPAAGRGGAVLVRCVARGSSGLQAGAAQLHGGGGLRAAATPQHAAACTRAGVEVPRGGLSGRIWVERQQQKRSRFEKGDPSPLPLFLSSPPDLALEKAGAPPRIHVSPAPASQAVSQCDTHHHSPCCIGPHDQLSRAVFSSFRTRLPLAPGRHNASQPRSASMFPEMMLHDEEDDDDAGLGVVDRSVCTRS